ncbi:hypothetical protein QFZ91_005625 [Paraburkholderia sp. JPY419]
MIAAREAPSESSKKPRTPYLANRHRAAALHRHQLFALGFTQIHFAHALLDQCNFIGSMD